MLTVGDIYLQVCPVCATRVGVDMVAHITLQHGNIFKISLTVYLFSRYVLSFWPFTKKREHVIDQLLFISSSFLEITYAWSVRHS